MILPDSHSDQYISDYINGKIEQGLAIDIKELDQHLRYKQGQFNIINGLDNVGKTIWILWYFLCIAIKHGKKFCIWSGENSPSHLVRYLIEFYEGEKLKDIEPRKVYSAKAFIQEHFNFIDHSKFYTNKDLYEIFRKSGADCCLIDPFTGLNRKFGHEDNYQFLNETRNFVNETGITVYVNTHVVSEASRTIFPQGHAWFGYPKPPMKSQSEGGQPFANRPDDFITIHRLVGHPDMGYKTLLYVRKVKDTETGGIPNSIDNPIIFDWNYGKGFVCNNINPLNEKKIESMTTRANSTFMNH